MKNIKHVISMNIILLVLTCNLNAQTIQIDSTFSNDGEIFPFTTNQIIQGLKVSGSIEFNYTKVLREVVIIKIVAAIKPTLIGVNVIVDGF